MHWQDLVITVGQIIFVLSLLPSILSKNKPALLTSSITALILYIFTFVYITLSLYFAAISVAATAVGWSVLAYQKYRLEKK